MKNLAILSSMFPGEFAAALDATLPKKYEQGPPTKCQLPGCDKPAAPKKRFCCADHFGLFEKRRKGLA